MNKFVVLTIAGVLVFAAVAAQLAQAAGGLTSELDDAEEIDAELEGGGFKDIARKVVGVHHTEEWGRDILDEDSGLSEFAAKRTRACKGVKNKEQCKTCCMGNDKAYDYNRWSGFIKGKGCTCFDRDNAYAKHI